MPSASPPIGETDSALDKPDMGIVLVTVIVARTVGQGPFDPPVSFLYQIEMNRHTYLENTQRGGHPVDESGLPLNTRPRRGIGGPARRHPDHGRAERLRRPRV